MASDLPIIDLSPLHTLPKYADIGNGESIKITPNQIELAKKIREACRYHGFFYVCNHGIDTSLIDNMMHHTRDLFDMPSAEKRSISSKNNDLFRGYISTSDALHTCNSKAKEEVGNDQKESFTLGAEGHGPMRGQNQWPSATLLPKFKETVQNYWDAQLTLCRVIARGLALSLSLDPYFFECHLTSPVAQMVLLSYPPPPKSSLENSICRTKHTGCGEHTDCGFLTILAQDSPGLEVQDPQTLEWNLVHPLENMFVVNLGDMTARWTNDAYKSTKHRVYNQNENVRYSIPFFCNCNFDAPVECILTDDDMHEGTNNHPNNTAKYEATTAGAYIMERLGLMRK